MIRCKCPACRVVLKAPDRAAGRISQCPRCGQHLRLPDPETQEEAVVAITQSNHSSSTIPPCERCGATVAGVLASRVSVAGYVLMGVTAAFILFIAALGALFFFPCFLLVFLLPLALGGLLIRAKRWECPSCGAYR